MTKTIAKRIAYYPNGPEDYDVEEVLLSDSEKFEATGEILTGEVF